MKKGSKVKIVKEQINRQQWMVDNNIYWGWMFKDGDFHMSSLKVGDVYEVLKTRGVKSPIKGCIEISSGVENQRVLVLKEDVVEVNDE